MTGAASNTNSPIIEHVRIYFLQKGVAEGDANAFFGFYETRQWKSNTGRECRYWKTLANKWIYKLWKSNPLLFERKQ